MTLTTIEQNVWISAYLAAIPTTQKPSRVADLAVLDFRTAFPAIAPESTESRTIPVPRWIGRALYRFAGWWMTRGGNAEATA
jgi:hypothetical protein